MMMPEHKHTYHILLDGLIVGQEYAVSKWQAIDMFANKSLIDRHKLKSKIKSYEMESE
tara:strand:- start:672 stop:845 length:174 start_codon:yes stop_codon:yes gene_type:complete